jgi:hypothetical protein
VFPVVDTLVGIVRINLLLHRLLVAFPVVVNKVDSRLDME